MLERLINSLRNALHQDAIGFGFSMDAIALATKAHDVELNTLPIVLWQYGFLNARQLDLVFQWLEVS